MFNSLNKNSYPVCGDVLCCGTPCVAPLGARRGCSAAMKGASIYSQLRPIEEREKNVEPAKAASPTCHCHLHIPLPANNKRHILSESFVLAWVPSICTPAAPSETLLGGVNWEKKLHVVGSRFNGGSLPSMLWWPDIFSSTRKEAKACMTACVTVALQECTKAMWRVSVFDAYGCSNRRMPPTLLKKKWLDTAPTHMYFPHR